MGRYGPASAPAAKRYVGQNGTSSIRERETKELKIGMTITRKRFLRFLLAAVIIGGLLYSLAISGDAYKHSVTYIKHNPGIIEAIGTPQSIHLGFWGYSIKTVGPDGSASFEVNVRGEKGIGKVFVQLNKTNGQWKVVSGSLQSKAPSNSLTLAPEQ